MLAVIAVAAAVDYGFLRGNLAGRLADVSVSMVILAAWVVAKLGAMAFNGRVEMVGRQHRLGGVMRATAGGTAAVLVLVTGAVLVRPFRASLENAHAMEGPEAVRSAAGVVTERLRHTWPLPSPAMDSRADFALARYLQACTAPTDCVMVTEARAQIPGLAQRAFAAGHIDLRGGGFFGSVSEQELTDSDGSASRCRW